jgi:DNA (cytosine-5)-methyltransferase 1
LRGRGGRALGLHQAGFKPEGVIERDTFCCDTLRENKRAGLRALRDWHIVETDVRDVRFNLFADRIDLVSGGPPCQPFSLGGRHAAYDDKRDMFPQAVRAVRETRPKAFILENVKGLTRERFRNYVEYIRLQLQHPELEAHVGEGWVDHFARLERHHTSGSSGGSLRYNVVIRLLNAADFGVPQKRHRVFFVGFREDLGIDWAFPNPTHSEEALLWDQMTGAYWDRHEVSLAERSLSRRDLKRAESLLFPPPLKAWRTVRDALSGLPEPVLGGSDSVHNHRLQNGARSYAGHTGSRLDEPAKALKAGVHGVPGGENMLVRADGTVRYFTVREAARIQMFPDKFLFHGTWSETMRQLGNAVPVGLASIVGQSVHRQLLRASQGSGLIQ